MFPNIPAPGGDNGPEFSDCARKFLAAKPRKGAAVLFHSIKTTGAGSRWGPSCSSQSRRALTGMEQGSSSSARNPAPAHAQARLLPATPPRRRAGEEEPAHRLPRDQGREVERAQVVRGGCMVLHEPEGLSPAPEGALVCSPAIAVTASPKMYRMPRLGGTNTPPVCLLTAGSTWATTPWGTRSPWQ